MDGSRRLAQIFVELADTLVEEFDLVDFLQMLTERCVELLGIDASGLMLADQRGRLRLMASTAERARLLDVFELQINEGPCLDCFTTGRPVVNVDLAEAGERWPTFVAAAVEVGFRSTHALPMRLRSQVIGALALFSEAPVELAADDLSIGQAMADIATIGLLHERNLHEQTVLSEQLQTALRSRILIEQAKGVVAALTGLSISEAFTRMRAHGRRNQVTLTAVATSIVEGSIDSRILVRS